jgi:hypothetical protein
MVKSSALQQCHLPIMSKEKEDAQDDSAWIQTLLLLLIFGRNVVHTLGTLLGSSFACRCCHNYHHVYNVFTQIQPSKISVLSNKPINSLLLNGKFYVVVCASRLF